MALPLLTHHHSRTHTVLTCRQASSSRLIFPAPLSHIGANVASFIKDKVNHLECMRRNVKAPLLRREGWRVELKPKALFLTLA